MTYDILLINAHREHFGSVTGDISIGVNLLTQYLKENGYRVGMFRGFAHEAEQWMEKTMDASGARSIGFYCDYENTTLVAEFSRRAKDRWKVPVFVGGPQAVGLDESFLLQSRCDAVVRGEGELTLLELLGQYLRTGKGLSQIDGISYLDSDGNLVHRPDRAPITDLDGLPWPDFRLEQDSHSWSILPVMTGRGCPYHCAFCYEGGNTKRVRYRSVQNVMEEIACHLQRHPQCKYIFFIDDTFTLNPERVRQFCVELARLRKERDFVWFCEGHVQTLFRWPEMLKNMTAAGLVKLFIGIESGSDDVLKLYRKKSTVKMIESVVQNSVAAGIPQITGNIIIGGPIESSETLKAGTDLIIRLLHAAPGQFDSLGFFLMPYPNTAITRNPEKFKIRLLRERESHALEDIPLSESETLRWDDMFNARQELNRQFLKTMNRLFRSGKVPYETVVTNYRLAMYYGVYSRWLVNVFANYPIAHNYYQLLAGNAVSRSDAIPAGRLHSWHPQRVFSLWNTVSFDMGYPRIGRQVLSPLEYELLIWCSGKLRLSEVIKNTYGSFGELFDSRNSFENEALKLLRGFEKQRWLVYSRF